MDATIRQHFDRDVDTMFARLTDPEVLKRRAETLGERNVVISVEREPKLSIRIERDVDRNLPGFMKKVFSPTNHLIDTQHWTTTEPAKFADWTVEIIGQKRVELRGRLTLAPADDGGCDYSEEFSAHVAIPLIGGRVAKYVLGETEASIRRQIEFLSGELG